MVKSKGNIALKYRDFVRGMKRSRIVEGSYTGTRSVLFSHRPLIDYGVSLSIPSSTVISHQVCTHAKNVTFVFLNNSNPLVGAYDRMNR